MPYYSFKIFGCITILAYGFVPPTTITQHSHRHQTRSVLNPNAGIISPFHAFHHITAVSSSPIDDFFGGIFGNDGNKQEKMRPDKLDEPQSDDEHDMTLSSFQRELAKRQASEEKYSHVLPLDQEGKDHEEFSGYDLRDIIYTKYGECFDVEFQRVDSYGFRSVYLNIMPFRLGGKRFRHETEYDYLCHLQAVVEILAKYNQLDNVITQLMETTKKPRAGTSPLVAVPLRLDLTPEEVNKILG
ncbi:hypothetical protein ACHAWX_006753 [Stephanocyclus meneghinianus]